MSEVISRVKHTESPRVFGGFILLSLLLAGSSIGFAVGIFLEVTTTILGVLLAVAFVAMGGMVLAYHRLFHDHRIVIESGEDLW